MFSHHGSRLLVKFNNKGKQTQNTESGDLHELHTLPEIAFNNKAILIRSAIVFTFSLVVVEHLLEKSPHSNIFGFCESVHPQVPQKKSLHELLLGNF